jgi:protocatechuate 3,4-dioxygenase beta subunit
MKRSLLGLIVVLPALCSTAAAQPPTPRAIAPGLQPRDPVQQQPPATGTSRIRGRVAAADTGQAIRRAVVRISAPELRETRTTSTDPEGRYEFRDLPAGRYSVSASKGAFVTLNYGQTRPFEQGRPLQLLDNQSVEKIDFALPRGSIITGRVIDEYGDPVADVNVAPTRMQFSPQGRRPTPAGRFASTNDVGEFRIFGLPPGDYFVSASPRAFFEGPAGTTDDRSGYAATYYPGTPNIAEAQPIKVGVGETISDITVMMAPTRTARISGVAVDSEGKPLNGGMLMLIQRSGAGMFMGGPGGQIRPDGTFSVGGLAPGEYVLRAMANFAGPDAMANAATLKVTLNGADVDGLRLAPTTPSTISGKIIVDPASTGSLKPETVRLMAIPKDPSDIGFVLPQAPQPTKADGTFEMKSAAGTFTLNMMQAPNWMIKSAKHNGVDVIENGLEVRAGEDIENLQVEVTDRFPELSGSVADERGRPVIEFTAIAFPQQPAPPGSMARSSIGRPDQDGRFKIRPLRAGSYYVVAVDYVEQGQWLDPDYLERLRPSATRVTVADAEAKSIDLKVVKAP